MNRRPPLRIVTTDDLPNSDPWGSNKGHAPTTFTEREFGTYELALEWQVEVVPTFEAVAIITAGGKPDASQFYRRRVGPGPVLVDESWQGVRRTLRRPITFGQSMQTFDEFGDVVWDANVDAFLVRRKFGTTVVRIVITGMAVKYSFDDLDVVRRSFASRVALTTETA